MTNENQDASEEPKIIVDEDWKSQVEREKEELKKQETAQDDGADETSPDGQQIPPASYQILLSTLATQAMGALGIFPDPVSGQPQLNRPLAKHFIDTIGVLEEKTKGNLSEDEAKQTEDALHQLRMIYVASANAPGGEESDSETRQKSSTIELP